MSEATTIIAAAAASLPPIEHPAEFEKALRERSALLARMCSPKSPLHQLVSAMSSPEAKSFTGKVVGGTMEQRSTRFFVTLETGTTQTNYGPNKVKLPDGHEGVRTDRTDTPEGAKMAAKVRQFKDQLVRVWVVMEETGNKDKPLVRVLKDIELAEG